VEELEQVYEAALRAIRCGEAAAVATVLETHGSTPREASAKMLIYADGHTVSTVGGGPLEAQVIREAQAALSAGLSREFEYRATAGQHGAYHLLQDQDFLQAILENREPMVTGVEGCKTVEVFTAIYRSQRDRQPVRFPLNAELESDELDGPRSDRSNDSF
jgi:xanthine/CO dehydrogenase XdhC/CoxF family maturation factor